MTFSNNMITENYPGAKRRSIAERAKTRLSEKEVAKNKTRRMREERAHKFSRKEIDNWG